jgi:photosystem II stability/assembly factor-like uncharacterized protein
VKSRRAIAGCLLTVVLTGCGGGSGDSEATQSRAWLFARRSTGIVLLRSDDGAVTWEPVFVPSSGVGGVTFVDREHGWLAGSEILRTDDGGRSFSAQPVEMPPGQTPAFRDIAFADLDHGVAVGSAARDGHPFVRELVVQTDDGGATWKEPSFPDGRPDFGGLGNFILSDVCVTEIGVGLAVGGGGFMVANHASAFLSTSRGATWRGVGGLVGAGDVDGAFRGLACVGARDLWIVGTRLHRHFMPGETDPLTILHSVDAGRTWENQSSRTPVGDVDATLEDVAFVDARRGWAVGYEGDDTKSPLLLVTADAGAHWERHSVSDDFTEGSLREVAFATATDGVAIGDTPAGAALVFATPDGGRRWRAVSLPPDVDQVSGLNYFR